MKNRILYIIIAVSLIINLGLIILLYNSEIKTSTLESFCHGFSIDKCPSACNVSGSCPICLDIGCHAKGAHQ